MDQAIGANGKPVIIKKNIFERNAERHADLTADDNRNILQSALYNANLYGQNQKATRPYNWVVINTKDKEGNNRLVLIELSPEKENAEIVHWHYIDDKGLNKIKRQAEREDGQLLILPSEGSEEAGALSGPTNDLSSDGKATDNSSNLQVNGVKNSGIEDDVSMDERKVVEDKAKKRSMMERIAEKLGYRIEWHDTMDQNGLFDPETKTIHIALDAENPLAAVFGHESMHKIAENVEDYNSILALAKEVVGEKEFERRVDEAEKLYRDAGYDRERSYYEEEVVCDFMGEMLENDRLLERVCWDANHRVLAAIRNVIDRILSATGLKDARLMHVRLTVSAAYQNAIKRAETAEETPTPESERRASLLRKGEVDMKSEDYHASHKTGVTRKVLDAAQLAMDEMYSMMMPYYDATALGRRILPEERYGGKDAKSTIFANGSYGKTMENTLKCIRTLAYNEFTDDVKRVLGRPLTQKESFLASQMVYDIAADPQCMYCYVSLDRKAYDEFLLRYIKQRDEVLDKFRAMDEKERSIGNAAPHKALPELYGEFLSGRKDTKEQRTRFDMWVRNEMDGVKAVTGADLATADVRSAVLSGLDESMARQVKDAEKYAQSASWAKKDVDYISYIGELLRLSPAWIKKLTGEYGLRFYSFSEYTPAFLLENMQMVRDAALRGLRGLGYTKEIDFVKVFAPTGMNINCSCYGRFDSDGNMQMDTLQGADWEEVKELRNKYRNVGAVFVATNDDGVEWALGQDWIDVVIPFHIVRTGQDIADFYGWSNYSREQADSLIGSSRKMYISPVEHKNDKTAFLEACERHGVTPRFSKWIENPNYMKLVNETRLSVEESADLKPVFDMDAAKESWRRFVNRGGYYNGWWNVDAQGYADAVRTVVEDIRSGKMASDVSYGNQRMPVNPEKMIAAARKKRIHGNVPLVDVYDRSGNALSSGGKRASLRQQKTGSSASEATEAERAMRDELNNVLTRAGIEVVTDVDEGQRVLDEANGKVKFQAILSNLRNAIAFIRLRLKTARGGQFEIYVPESVNKIVERKIGHKVTKHLIDISGLNHGYSNHGVDGKKLSDNDIALTKEDFELIPYIMMSPDDIVPGSNNNGISSVRYIKYLSNGKIIYVEAEGNLDGTVLVSKNMWANIDPHKKSSQKVVDARQNDAPKLTSNNVILKEDAAKIRKDAETAIGNDKKFRMQKTPIDEVVNENNPDIRFFRTPDGHAYGFTAGGKIYINPRIATAETPIQEYSHLWSTALREQNPKEWKNIVELMKGTAVWDEVVRTYPELKTDESIADEVLAQYSGRRGAERLRQEMDAVLKSNSGITEKAAAVRAIRNIRSALNRFWRSVARMLGLRYTSAEDVADSVLRDMLNLEKPGETKPNWKMPQRESLDYKSSDDELGYSLWAIKSGINPAKKYLMDFFLFPTEKYRTVFPTPTTEDYFLSTRTDFKTVPTDDVKGTWEEMKNSGKYEYTKSPLSNSEYLVDHETGDIYRMSDHWGPASSCYWTLDGFPGQRYTAETIAKSNIKDFDVWHNKKEKTVPREFHMREYAREVEQSITNYRDVLAKVPMTDAHRARFERGLAMLEDVQRRLEEGGYKPKKEDLKYQKNSENGAYSLDNVEEPTTLSEKKDAHPTRLQTSNDAQAVQRDAHLSGTKVEINSGNREEINKNLDSLSAKVSESQLQAEEFLFELRKAMLTDSEDHSGYNTQIVDGELLTMRISDHHANAKHNKQNGEFKVVGVVIKTPYSNNRFRPHKEVEMIQYTFEADKLSHENEKSIVAGIIQWVQTGKCDIEGAVSIRRSPRPSNAYFSETTENDVKLADENAPVYREGESVDNSETDSESSEDYDLYRTVEDEDTIAFLEGQPSVTTYRSMVLIDGKLYPPMSSKESGSKQLRNPSELGKWEEAEEAPDKAYKKGNSWYFDLKKDNGKTVAGVAYNPYIHTSTTMLNDQFSEAQIRDNLVVVEMEVPESELTSGYKADKAKDSVGAKQWKAGIIQGMLSGTREVILTRWAKPVRIVPVEEVADHIVGLIEGKVEVMPTNVVTPQQREALEEIGVKFVETDNKGKIRDDNKNTVIFHEVRKKSGRRMCRQLPLTSFSQCFLTKGKRLTGGGADFHPRQTTDGAPAERKPALQAP